MSMSVCDSKVFYDTEFEATRAAVKTEFAIGEAMEPYLCPGSRHWHITHSDKSQRRGAGHRYAKCPDCGQIMKKYKMEQHIERCKGRE